MTVRSFSLALAALLRGSSPLLCQTLPSPRSQPVLQPGTRVRLLRWGPARDTVHVTGRLLAVRGDSLDIRFDGDSLGRTELVGRGFQLQVSRGMHHQLVKGLGFGVLVGGVVGGIAGAAAYQPCGSGCWFDLGRGVDVAAGASVGMLAGGVIGMIVGGAINTERWATVPKTARLTVRPGPGGMGVGVGATLAF